MALAPALKVEIAWDEDGFWEVLVEETEEGLEEVMVKVEDAVEEGVDVVDSETFGAEEEPVVTTEEVLEETEEMIQNSLKKMRQGRTTIAIAHRLSTIQDADCIYVLDKGKIIESGNHDQLIALGGTYKKMYDLQAGMMK